MRTNIRRRATIRLYLTFGLILLTSLLFANCQSKPDPGKTLTLAINSGVEGDALRQAATDYEAQTGIHINIAEFPYANLFEKKLIDLNARTGAYDLIMLDDPWFPKSASLKVLTDLTPLLRVRSPILDPRLGGTVREDLIISEALAYWRGV